MRAKPVKTSLIHEIEPSQPQARIGRLEAGAIQEPPRDLASLVFGSSDRVEMATAKCSPKPRSLDRIECAVSVHRLALAGSESASCIASLGLRELEFQQTSAGAWVNEDAIALCGGRLRRHTEFYPVLFNGIPRYALREEFQMVGGDRKCAAPYLRSRLPLAKAYVPAGDRRSHGLRCGTITTR